MKFLFLTNDLSRTGAPLVLLNFLIWIKNHKHNINIDIISINDGILEEKFRKNSNSLFIYKKNILQKVFQNILKTSEINILFLNTLTLKKNKKYDLVYVNTVVALPFAYYLFKTSKNTKIILHVHELYYAIKHNVPHFAKYLKIVDHYIAVSKLVESNLRNKYKINQKNITVIHPPATINNTNLEVKEKNHFEIGGAGEVRWQKGVDIFILLAKLVLTKYNYKDIYFTWVGKISALDRIRINHDLEKAGINKYVNFTGEKSNPHKIFVDFDVFALTSREDPFPLVCIEAGMLAKPIICFENVTGIQEILQFGGGYIVPYLDIEKMAEKIIFYYKNKEKLESDGLKSKKLFSLFTPEKIYPEIFNVILKVLKE